VASRVAFPGTAADGTTHTAADDNKLPGGWIGYAEVTSNSADFGATITDVAGLSVAVTVNSTRRIKVTANVNVEILSATEATNLYIREGTTILAMRKAGAPTGVAQWNLTFFVILTPSSGSHTYKISAQRATGSGSHHIAADANTTYGPSSILVTDIGPAS
jgi:hypothetical protein